MRIRRETLHADTVSLQSNPVAMVSPVSGGASLARQWLDTGDGNKRNRPFKMRAV